MNRLVSLAKELDVNERTLRRAVSNGSLRATRTTPRTLRVSLAEQRYIRHAWPLISALRRALRTEHNVRLAVLFGSAARGTDTPQSDVDVLVALRDASLDRVVDLEVKLTRATGRRVEIVRLEDAELQPAFLADVTGDGRVLVDRDGLGADFRGRAARLEWQRRSARSQETKTVLAGVDRFLGARDHGKRKP
jgi:predicted nucleotidyltransferase